MQWDLVFWTWCSHCKYELTVARVPCIGHEKEETSPNPRTVNSRPILYWEVLAMGSCWGRKIHSY